MSSTEAAVREAAPVRRAWDHEGVMALFELPFNDLLHRAHCVHRANFDPNEVQLSTLLNIKSGGCPEDCAYCPQSVRYPTGVEESGLMDLDAVVAAATAARDNGATRFCMGAAWRRPREKELLKVVEMVEAVNALGLESCATLGMLTREQAQRLKAAGLAYYNHNLDTSADYYGEIITTRCFEDRLETLAAVREAGIKVCCGGIIGMGEAIEDRAALLVTLANLETPPESVPINLLVRVAGTPLGEEEAIDPLEMVRMIAVARILMPSAWLRLSAGRSDMDEGVQALCFHAGANSVFYGERLLTTANPDEDADRRLFRRLGMKLKT